jgi:chemotaxis protein CheX
MPGEQDIRQFTETIWDAVLHLPIAPSGPVDLSQGDTFAVTVRISGAWRGEVLFGCRHSFAERAASIMFALGKSQLDEFDIKDAVTELANMIGGQWKSLVPGPSSLLIPCIDNHQRFTETHGKEQARINFDCEGEPLLITISEMEQKTTKAA